MKNLRVVFMGTPTFAVPILESLIESYNVILVVAQPDKEKDKKGNIIYPPIKEVAIKHNIPVIQPVKIKEDYDQILKSNPDIIITCAYGQIIPKIILDFPKYGSINVHGSLLPKLRGGAPIHHALIDGYQTTGITIMYMDQKMDAGDIISQREIKIEPSDNMGTLFSKLSLIGRDLLIETLPSIIAGTNNRIKQNETEVTYGYNITKEQEKLDFNKTSLEIVNLIRGLNPEPGAYTIIDGKRIKLFNASVVDQQIQNKTNGEIIKVTDNSFLVKTTDGLVDVTDIQLEGKKRVLVKDYFNGIDSKNLIGKVLGE